MKNFLNIVFAGTPEFAAIVLDTLIASKHNVQAVFTQPDRPAGRGQHLQASAVKLRALQHQLPLLQPTSLKNIEIINTLQEFNADLMIVVAYGLLIPPAVLTLPRYGCINIHASLLPRWRGAAPIQRAIMANDPMTGITIMQMDAGLDTGPMLKKDECPIYKNDTSATLHDRLAPRGATLLLETLDDLLQHKLAPEIQDDNLSCYAKKIIKSEALINWSQSAVEIDCLIRGLNPEPIAYSYLNQQAIKIWCADVIATATEKPPGTIVAMNKTSLDVATGNGLLRLLTLQWPGKKPLPVRDILNARARELEVGQTFKSEPL